MRYQTSISTPNFFEIPGLDAEFLMDCITDTTKDTYLTKRCKSISCDLCDLCDLMNLMNLMNFSPTKLKIYKKYFQPLVVFSSFSSFSYFSFISQIRVFSYDYLVCLSYISWISNTQSIPIIKKEFLSILPFRCWNGVL